MYYVDAICAATAAGIFTSVAVWSVREVRAIRANEANEQMQHGALGAYRLFWHSGGSSVAAVGMLDDGTRWYAPANWTNREPGAVVSTDWSLVKHADLIER